MTDKHHVLNVIITYEVMSKHAGDQPTMPAARKFKTIAKCGEKVCSVILILAQWPYAGQI